MRRTDATIVRLPPEYRQVQRLGRGRSGAVYLVEERKTGRLVALKILAAAYEDRALGALRQEFLTLKHLSHPFLGQVHDFPAPGEGSPYLVREFVPGKTLGAGPPAEGSDPKDYLRPVLDVLAALAFLHHNGIAHLDLHPGNVIERPDGHGTIIDVGFFPPEGAPAGRFASDLYAAGKLLIYRLTGREEIASPLPPMKGWDDRLVMHLEHVIRRAMAPDATVAFARAQDLLAALCSVLGLATFELLAPGENQLFVGQKKALEAAETFLEKLGRTGSACLWVCGAPGSGKSRFLAEVAARAGLGALGAEARTDVAYLEAWNDCFAGLAREGCGDDGRQALAAARESFAALGIPFGVARAEVGLVAAAVRRRDEGAVRPILHRLETMRPPPHARLEIEVPLACAEACLFLGEADRARQHLTDASAAVVGKRFPEIDVRLETAWARLAALSGDVGRARQHLHRAMTLRGHIAERVAPAHRARFLAQRRWGDLAELDQTLFRPQRAAAPERGDRTFGIVARSEAMQKAIEQVRSLGPQELSVVIRGPTGSGKDLVALAVHEASPRAGRPFVPIHVPSLREELFESELFGYARGAFTGAEQDRAGLLESAGRGTVLFDEIGSLGLEAQAKLLRVLDRREARPVGSARAVALDVRFLFTTTKDLRSLASHGAFREDLFWRIAGAEIIVPRLSQRKDDIPELVAILLRKHARLGRPAPEVSADILAFLAGRPWPGNVRQLEAVLVRAMLASGGGEPLSLEAIRAALSSPPGAAAIPEELVETDDLDAVRHEVEIAWLRKRFLDAEGSMSELARRLKLSRTSLYDWFRRLGVDPEIWREDLGRP